MASYDIGDCVRFSVTFVNSAGNAADPTVIRFRYKASQIALTTLTYATDITLVRDDVGEYHVDLSITAAGKWYFRWEGTGAVQAATEGQFAVNASAFY